MKVGMIGLGHIGEGMSRRMINDGIEVWGYGSNYEKAEEQYEAGYISGCVTEIKYLVRAVKSDGKQFTSAGVVPGIFHLVIPAHTVDDTLDELIPLLEESDIIIDHSNRDITKCQELEKYCSKLGISYIFSGVYGAPYAVDACSKIFQSLSPGNATRI
jgi:6-phosphogluconate dehydrogenase